MKSLMNSENVKTDGEMKGVNNVELGRVEDRKVDIKIFSKNKTALLLVAAILFVAVTSLVLFFNRNNAASPGTFMQSDQDMLFTSDSPVLCTVLGFQSLQCEDVNTQEVVKYVLPKDFKRVNTVQSSPDGTKFIVSYMDNKQTLKEVVVDSEFNVLQTLKPSVEPASGTEMVYNQYVWLAGSKTIAHTRIGEVNMANGAPRTTVTIIDATKSDSIVAGPINIESRVGGGDNIVGGYNDKLLLKRLAEYDAESPMSKPDELFWVDIAGPEARLQKIDTSELFYENGVQKAVQGISVNLDTDNNIVYAVSQSSADDSTQPFFAVGKIVDLPDGAKTLSADVPSLRPYALYSSGLLRTAQGLVVDENNDFSKIGNPLILQYAGGTQDIKLAAVSSQIYFVMSNMPGLERSQSNEPIVADFLQMPADTPTAIRTFAESLVKKDCGDTMYASIEVMGYVGEEQFQSLESGCGRDATYFYIRKDGKYKEVFVTQEGIDCEQRDKLGISPKLTTCRLPGEGL